MVILWHNGVCTCSRRMSVCVGRVKGVRRRLNPHTDVQSGIHLGLLSKQSCAVLHGCSCKRVVFMSVHVFGCVRLLGVKMVREDETHEKMLCDYLLKVPCVCVSASVYDYYNSAIQTHM